MTFLLASTDWMRHLRPANTAIQLSTRTRATMACPPWQVLARSEHKQTTESVICMDQVRDWNHNLRTWRRLQFGPVIVRERLVEFGDSQFETFGWTRKSRVRVVDRRHEFDSGRAPSPRRVNPLPPSAL